MEAGVDNMAFIPMKDTEEQECRFLVTNLIKTDPWLTKAPAQCGFSSLWCCSSIAGAHNLICDVESSSFLWVARGSWIKATSQQRSKRSHSHESGTWNCWIQIRASLSLFGVSKCNICQSLNWHLPHFPCVKPVLFGLFVGCLDLILAIWTCLPSTVDWRHSYQACVSLGTVTLSDLVLFFRPPDVRIKEKLQYNIKAKKMKATFMLIHINKPLSFTFIFYHWKRIMDF